jgi:hypothetical protein
MARNVLRMDTTNNQTGERQMSMQEKLDRAFTQNLAAEIALRRLLAKTRAAAQTAKVTK